MIESEIKNQQLAPGSRRDTNARQRILGSAETIFATHGFDGTSLRQIARAADVPQALVSYHFEGKAGLYRAIFELRSPMIVDQRLAGLQLAQTETDPDKRLELVVKALIVPMINLRNTEKNASFARILAREVSDPNNNERKIIKDFFDPVAREMIKAIGEALPDRSLEEIHWGYHTLLGAMIYAMSDAGRIANLSGGRCDPDDAASTTEHLVALLHAALKHGRVRKKH